MAQSNARYSRPPAWQVATVVAVLFGIACAALFITWRESRPTALPDLATEKFACASYTPSHNGHALGVAATRALVASDLKILAGRFRCIRTYSVSEGLDDVPRIARELKLKVMLGLWIGSDMASNDAEIAHGVALANQYADVVTAVIVGNEVLLRRELLPEQLKALIERVRAQTRVPVTYADVWDFWLRNAQLAAATNFVTVHILPYWEDQPIGIDHALDHVRNIHARVQAAFPGKTIFIGETGWPSAGRPRMEATPGLINEARFIREFVAWADANHVEYNLIEAFDQPWKRIQEGTVGGYWGLYDADAKPKFAFKGSMSAARSARDELIGALIGALLCVALAWPRNHKPSARAFALLGTAGYCAGYAAVAQWTYLSLANRSALEWSATLSWSAVGWIAYALIVRQLARWLDGHARLVRPASAASVVRSWGHGDATASNENKVAVENWSRSLGLARLLFLIGLAYVSLALAYDGRGRDFPLALIGLPIVAFALLEIVGLPEKNALGNEELLLALAVLCATLFVGWHETLHNTRAMAWCALCLLFVATLLIGHFRALRPNERAEQEPDAAQLERI